MTFIIIWKDKTIQCINGDTIEEALKTIDFKKEDLEKLDYWEDTYDTIYPKHISEIDETKL